MLFSLLYTYIRTSWSTNKAKAREKKVGKKWMIREEKKSKIRTRKMDITVRRDFKFRGMVELLKRKIWKKSIGIIPSWSHREEYEKLVSSGTLGPLVLLESLRTHEQLSRDEIVAMLRKSEKYKDHGWRWG